MSQQNVLDKLFDQYRFTSPLSSEMQQASIAARSAVLKTILIKHGSSAVFTAATVKLFFFLKKMGISLTLGKCAAVIITMVITVGSAVAVPGILIVRDMLKKDTVQAPASIHVLPESQTDSVISKTPVRASVPAAPLAKPKLEIVPFAIQSSNDEGGAKLTQSLQNNFSAVRGKSFAVVSGGSSEDAPMILTGSIRKNELGYSVQARLVDASNSRVLLMITETASDEKEIEGAAKRIVQKVLGSM
jgi:hypothetical protein